MSCYPHWVRACVPILVIALLLSGCAQYAKVRVTGAALHREIAALRRNGEATVEATRTKGGQRPRRILERVRSSQELALGDKRYAIVQLMNQCPDTPPFLEDVASARSCPLVVMREQNLIVRSTKSREFPGVASIASVILLSGTIASITCLSISSCSDDPTADGVSKGTLIATGVIAAGALVWAIVSCSGRWGQPGCRD